MYFQAHMIIVLQTHLRSFALTQCYRDIFNDPHIQTVFEWSLIYVTRNDIYLILKYTQRERSHVNICDKSTKEINVSVRV